MKRFFVCLMLALILIFPSQSVVAAQGTTSAYDYLTSFIEENPSRKAGSPGETAAAEWLYKRLQVMGYQTQKQKVDLTQYNYEYDASYNVLATKLSTSAAAKTVIVGAHYDSVTEGGCQGVADNGCGVAVLLAIADRLKTEELPFNVMFAFFGSEEIGSIGAYHFAEQLSSQEKDNVLLMINIDTVGTGDNLYIWGEDISNPQTDYFVEKSGGKISKAPRNSGVMMNFSSGFRPYYEVMHASDSTEFLAQGIPVAFFFSGNFSSGSFGYVENAAADDITHTSHDTLKYIESREDIKLTENMDVVADTVCAGLTDSGFVAAVQNARSHIASDFWTDPLYALLFLGAFMIVAAVLAVIYYKKLQKRAILGTPDVKNTTVFTKPDDDDVFTFRS